MRCQCDTEANAWNVFFSKGCMERPLLHSKGFRKEAFDKPLVSQHRRANYIYIYLSIPIEDERSSLSSDPGRLHWPCQHVSSARRVPPMDSPIQRSAWGARWSTRMLVDHADVGRVTPCLLLGFMFSPCFFGIFQHFEGHWLTSFSRLGHTPCISWSWPHRTRTPI